MSPTFKIVAVLSLALAATACSPKHQEQSAGTGTTANGATVSTTESGTDFRSACASDIQKYCANDPRKRRCLKDNLDKLGDACKTAMNAPRAAGAGHGQGIGRVCADDLQKFCANDPKRFRCLKNNLNQLSDACKTAVSSREDRGKNGSQ
jgi:cytochrome c556